MEIATSMRKASIPKDIHSQFREPLVSPISAPVTAIITAAPAASDMIFTDDAMPIRSNGIQSRISARPGPYAIFTLVCMNIQTARRTPKLGASRMPINPNAAKTEPQIIKGTRRPSGDFVRSLMRPIVG